MPNLDSAPVFARIIDDADGRCLELAPDGKYTVRRQYSPARTCCRPPSRRRAASRPSPTRLRHGRRRAVAVGAGAVRRIAGMRGEVRFRWAVRPGTRLRTAAPWIKKHDGVHLLQVGSTMLAVIGSEVRSAARRRDFLSPLRRARHVHDRGGLDAHPRDHRERRRAAAPGRSGPHGREPRPLDRGLARLVEGSPTTDRGRMPCSAAPSP